MKRYLLLFRGINVGGKNKIPMSELRTCLETMGFKNVSTYIASGNACITTALSPETIRRRVEAELPIRFTLDSKLVKVLVVGHEQVQAIVDNKPAGFGDSPDKYHSDVIFLMDITEKQALPVFRPRDGIDKIWPGKGVIYSQRLSAERAKSRLSAIVGTTEYTSMTIRSWNTTRKLLGLLKMKG